MKPSANKLTKVQQEEVEALLLSSLNSLNLDAKNIQKVFSDIRRIHKSLDDTLVNSIEQAGIYESAIVGEWGDYAIIDESKLQKAKGRRDENLNRLVMISRTQLLEAILMPSPYKGTETGLNCDRNIAHHKKYKALRSEIRSATLGAILCGDEITDRDIQWFQQSMIPFWRRHLETFRMSLHLAGKPTYSEPIQHADLFIKILETEL